MKKFLRVLAVAMLLLAIAIPCLAETTKCEHNFVVNTGSSKAATCTEDGYTVYSCNKCFAESANYTVKVPATGHDWGNPDDSESIDPGCGTTGKEVRHCKNGTCTATKEDIIPATGKHTAREVWASDNKDVAPTCDKAGSKALTMCSSCGVVLTTEVIPATGAHIYDKVKTVKEPTCTEEGYTLTYCSVCGKEQAGSRKTLKANGHGDSTGFVYESKAATCENNRFIYEICSVCGEKINEKEDKGTKLAHNWDKGWVTVKEATCTEKGSQQKTCVACKKTETREIAALGHDIKNAEIEVISAQTCTENSVHGRRCKRCKEFAQTWTNKDKLGHKEVVTITPATCDNEGSVVTACATCKVTLKTETIAKLKHVGEWKVTKEACECTAGSMSEICKNCKAVLDTKVIAATGKGEHKASDWTIVRQPNAYQEGKAIKTCEYCGVQLAKKYFTNASSLGNNVKVDTSKKDTTSTTTSSKNNTTTSTSKNNTATTSNTKDTKAVVTVEPVVVKEWKLGEKFEIADGVFMTITLNAETNKYDVVVEGVDNIETAKIAFVAADATEAPADEAYTDLIASNWVIDTVDEAAILYIVID